MVEVLKEEIHEPAWALEFFPDQYYFYSGRKSYLNLYIDTTQIPVGTEIKFERDNPNFILDFLSIIVGEENKIHMEIGKIKVPITGVGINQECKVEASCCNVSVFAKIKIISKRESPIKGGGKFSGDWRYEDLDREIRTDYDAGTGDILINSNHPVNKTYFGEDAKESYEKHLHCQIYLADIILDECLNNAIGEAYIRGKLTERLDAATDIRTNIEHHRYKIGKEIHKYFVKSDLLQKFKE